MKTISRVVAILGLASFMGGIPSAVRSQPSPAKLLAPNTQDQSSDSGVRRFFSPIDYEPIIQNNTANNAVNPDETVVFNYNVATACAEARDDQANRLSPDLADINDGFSSAGRQLTTQAVVNCSAISASLNNNTSASLNKQIQSAPLPNYQPFYVIRLGDTNLPMTNYRQRGDAMIQTPIVRF
jgi:hypothetical protein